MNESKIQILAISLQLKILKSLLDKQSKMDYNKSIQNIIIEITDDESERDQQFLQALSKEELDLFVHVLENSMIPYDD